MSGKMCIQSTLLTIKNIVGDQKYFDELYLSILKIFVFQKF